MDFKGKKSVVNPREGANVLSKLFFMWILPLFIKGSKQDLHMDDLYDVLKEDESDLLGTRLADAWDSECRMALQKNQRPRLYKVMIIVFWKKFAFLGCCHMFNEWVVRVGQTILLQKFIASIGSDQGSLNNGEAYYYGTGMVLATLLYTLIFHPTVFGLTHIGMKCRIACSSLIYRKAVKINQAVKNKVTVGQLVNLLSNDVSRFDNNILYLHYLYVTPLQGLIFTYLLWTLADLRWACLAGAGFVFLLVPIQYYIGNLTAAFRFQTAKRTDVRAQIVNEIIVAIRVIKMYAWEAPFSKLVGGVRKLEVSFLRKTGYLRAFYMSMYTSSARMMMFLTVLTLVLDGGELRADQIFFALSIYNILQMQMVWFLPTGAAHLGELTVALNRIESFLIQDEQKVPNPTITFTTNGKEQKSKLIMPPQQETKSSIVMKNVCASWTEENPTLTNLSIDLEGDRVIMVIGSVGSGKTSLLQVILCELPLTTGTCQTHGKICYASQEPWIFSGNVRQNILFGRDFDEARYNQVIEASALDEDLKHLPHGDKTIVGDRGIQLSGGQKARLNLARALYRQGDIYLLDDPLSAVDSIVSRHIFDKCIRHHFLQGKLRILVTHQLQYLPQADDIIVLDHGKIVAHGTYTELVKQGIDFVGLTTGNEEVDDSNRGKDGVQEIRSGTESVSQNGQKKVEEGRRPEAQNEKMAGGSVTVGTYWQYFRSGSGLCGMFVLCSGFLLSQLLSSSSDYWLALWTTEVHKSRQDCEAGLNLTQIVYEINNEVGNIDDDNSCADSFVNDTYLYIYTGLVVGFFVLAQGRALYFFRFCMNISVKVHQKMFSSMIRAPTKFFDENPSGRIMNRFTKDLGSMDELLPPAFFDSLVIFLQTCGMFVIVIISNYVMAIPIIILIGVLGLTRKFYIATSRHVKRIEAINRSPIFIHFVATLQGLTTIRASKSTVVVTKQFDDLQDIHSSAWFIFISANRWLGIWLEMSSLIFLIVVTYSFLLLPDWFGGSHVGLQISSVLGLTSIFQWGMRQSAETENHMTSTERVLEYSKLESEAALESKMNQKPPKSWPAFGEIKFSHVHLAYNEANGDVLKNISFLIKPREKIGIVGPTGAGKSSIIACLFRLTELRLGEIFLDGIRINDIGLHDLRRKLSVIPQDPVLFSGSIRYNLDPFDEFRDDVLYKVLQEVQLSDAVKNLDMTVEDRGVNFSVGQRQLVCLARAILRQASVLVMDEATANVDPQTDSLIQETIRSKFSACTIITIAHRLHSVMDSDKILVIHNGCVKEYDHPHILLERSGALANMVGETGPTSSQVLSTTAKKTYFERLVKAKEGLQSVPSGEPSAM